MSNRKILTAIVLLLCFQQFVFAVDRGAISGVVKDADTGDVLPGANLMVEANQLIGAASDLRGKYVINNVPVGDYVLKVAYIGYETKSVPIKVEAKKVTNVDVELDYMVLEGEEVTITAQAAGQTAAINQQVRANSIKNVISAQRIQEIPEGSAADAVGRLPGISLKGSELVIRGLSPSFNQIQIDGVDIASTNHMDRSQSLGMISQYMLEGVEMTKTSMADREGDVMGATVNLIMREAPEAPTMNFLVENGYNTLSESFGNIKLVGSTSRRFFDGKFGIYANVNYEKSAGATDEMGASFNRITQGLELNNVSLTDKDNYNNRIGTSIVMDYKSALTKIKLSSFYSHSGNESEQRKMQLSNGGIANTLKLVDSNMDVMTNNLRLERYVGAFKVDGGVSYSRSVNKMPRSIDMTGTDELGITTTANWDIHPLDVQQYQEFTFDRAGANSFNYEKRESLSDKLSTDLNFSTEIQLSKNIGLKLKFGGKYKRQTKEHDLDDYFMRLGAPAEEVIRNKVIGAMDWLPNPDDLIVQGWGTLAYSYFYDPNYRNSDFLLGDFVLEYMPDPSKLQDVHGYLKDNNYYYTKWQNTYKDDYHGQEDYSAAYFMPQLQFGKMFTFIPGVRYERNRTEYNGFRLPLVPSVEEKMAHPEFADMDTSIVRTNEYILPMIHLITRPTDWMDVKASYTHTLSRPNFGAIIPSWASQEDKVNWNNPHLEPAMATNWDLYLSFYTDKIGLFTLGGFHKEIDDLIFDRGELFVTAEDLDTDTYGGLPDSDKGKTINPKINNSRPATLYGFETEWQSNFWFLPGALKGLVLNVNYTHFKSQADYPEIERELIFDPATFQMTYTFTDTFYTTRLLDQANDIVNVTVGFDYKKFSIRASMKYTDDLFRASAEDPMNRKFTDERIDYDISIKQGLPLEGLSAYCNLSNISRSRYTELIAGNGFPTLDRYGGLGIAIGLRYAY